MKKKLIVTSVLSVLLLTACANNNESSSVHESISQSHTTESPNQTLPDTKSESRTSAVTEEAKPETSSLFTDYVLDGAENLSVNGEVLDSAELAEFEYDVLRLEDYKPELSKFLSVSGLTEIAEQCARGYTRPQQISLKRKIS